MNLFILSSLVEYCCCGTATVAADVTITHVEADLGHTMMLNDPKNKSNPAVFFSIFSLFGRIKNYYFRAAVAFAGIIFHSRLHF